MSSPKDRIDLRVAGTSGHVGSRPVPVATNAAGSIEVGAYRVTDTGFSFTVVCVERVGKGEQFPDPAFFLTSASGPKVRLNYAELQVVSTPVAHTAAPRLTVTTPFGDRGVPRFTSGDTIGRRANGDRIVQHGFVVQGLPVEIAATRAQETRVEELWRSLDVDDLRSAVHAAAALSPSRETIEVEVSWPAANLRAEVKLDMTYTPHADNTLDVDLGH